MFKGNKKPVSKEGVLIFDTKTGEITLERVSSMLAVKKSRDGPKPPSQTLQPSMDSSSLDFAEGDKKSKVGGLEIGKRTLPSAKKSPPTSQPTKPAQTGSSKGGRMNAILSKFWKII